MNAIDARYTRLAMRLVLVGALVGAGLAGRALAADLAGPAAPAACVTKTVIEPKEAGWAYVMNFESFSASGAPRGCLVVWRLPRFRPTDYVVSDCASIGSTSEISYSLGNARFNGGYVACDFNIKTALAALPIPIAVSDGEQYTYFTIIGVGAFSAPAGTPVSPNPIGYYEPGNAGYPPAALFVSLSANGGQLTSVANNITDTGRFLPANQLAPGIVYTIANAYDGPAGVLTNTHYLSDTAVAVFGPRAPVTFWTNGGKFWIGGSPVPAAKRLLGNFDEIIFDPPDGGAPPPPAARSTTMYEVFAPWLGN